jgi:hypothetical protein
MLMRLHHGVLGLAALGMLAMVTGCGGATPSPDGGAIVNGNGPPTGPHSMAPVVVTLSQGQVNSQTGETDVLATIDVHEPISYPVSLVATAPRSGQLTAGVAEEQLTLDHAGQITRSFRVRTPGPLSIDDPFRLVVRGQSPNGAVGFVADRQFPPRPEASPVQPNGPRPPGGRPPGPH